MGVGTLANIIVFVFFLGIFVNYGFQGLFLSGVGLFALASGLILLAAGLLVLCWVASTGWGAVALLLGLCYYTSKI